MSLFSGVATVLVLAGPAEAQSFKGTHAYFSNVGNPTQDIINAGAKRIGISFVWPEWEPYDSAGGIQTCDYDSTTVYQSVLFGGRRYCVSTRMEEAVQAYSNAGVVITGLIYGAPRWANGTRVAYPFPYGTPPANGCSAYARQCHTTPGASLCHEWCAPDPWRITEYAAFAGFLASRYPMISDWVVWNEVNSRGLYGFDVGDPTVFYDGNLSNYWMDFHNALFGEAFDKIRLYNTSARVRVSLTGYFGASDNIKLSGRALLDRMNANLGTRDWKVNIHTYSVHLPGQAPFGDFGAWDWIESNPNVKIVTAGTIGRLTGMLRKDFSTHASDVLIGEAGYTSLGLATEADQDTRTCNSYRNALGSPGVSGYLTNTWVDSSLPCQNEEACLGLRRGDYSGKPAFITWSTMASPAALSCGFEHRIGSEQATRLQRYVQDGQPNRHWVTTRLPNGPTWDTSPPQLPPSYTADATKSWRLYRSSGGARVELFDCQAGGDAPQQQDHFVSTSATCDGLRPMGSLGFIDQTPQQQYGPQEIHRCYNPSTGSHTIHPRTNPWVWCTAAQDVCCPAGGWQWESYLGYAYP